jgi:AraC-like DNA-binding protein
VSFQPQVRYAALSGYGALGDSLGLDWAPLMRGAGLDPAGLAVPDRWVPPAAVARLLEVSAAASGREDFGLRLAGWRRLAHLGPLALVIREEPDVRSVLEMLIRYEHAYNQAISIALSEAGGLATIVARVRALIEALLPAGHCSIVQVARSLGVDRRTVQRRLAGSGHSSSSLRDPVRADLAERLVPNPRRSLTQIAEELGFSEPSAFSRWFRGRFGASPSQWRNQAMTRP